MKKFTIGLTLALFLTLSTGCTLPSEPTPPASPNPLFSDYEWEANAPIDKETIKTTAFEIDNFSRLGGLTPAHSFTEKRTEGCNNNGQGEPATALRREGGRCGVFVSLEDKDGNKIESSNNLQTTFGPVENEAEAVSFVALTQSDVKTSDDGTQIEAQVAAAKDGYVVHVSRKNTFGCNMHVPTGELYFVQKNGEVQLLASEPKKRGTVCVD